MMDPFLLLFSFLKLILVTLLPSVVYSLVTFYFLKSKNFVFASTIIYIIVLLTNEGNGLKNNCFGIGPTFISLCLPAVLSLLIRYVISIGYVFIVAFTAAGAIIGVHLSEKIQLLTKIKHNK